MNKEEIPEGVSYVKHNGDETVSETPSSKALGLTMEKALSQMETELEALIEQKDTLDDQVDALVEVMDDKKRSIRATRALLKKLR